MCGVFCSSSPSTALRASHRGERWWGWWLAAKVSPSTSTIVCCTWTLSSTIVSMNGTSRSVRGQTADRLGAHGWEIAVILRNFRKTKLSKSKKNFFFNSISTYIQCATRRLSLCDIRKYHFPAFYGTSDRQAAIFF